MLRYLLSVDVEITPKTFTPSIKYVLRLHGGKHAYLKIGGGEFTSYSCVEKAEVDKGVIQLIHPRASEKAAQLLATVDLPEFLDKLDAFFAGVIVDEHCLWVFRDHVGLVPAYVSSSHPLWVTNLPAEAFTLDAKPVAVKPGTMLDLLSHNEVRYLVQRKGDVKGLLTSLRETIEWFVQKKKPAVFFSGGLDSLLIAKTCIDLGLEPVLLTIGVKGSGDFQRSEQAAKALGCDVDHVVVDEEEVVEAYVLLEKLLGKMGPMDAAIAVAMHLLSRRAVARDVDVALTGQGADELFAGYKRYEEVHRRYGYSGLEERLRMDFVGLHVFSLPRDFISVRSAGGVVIPPFLGRRVVEAAADIPAELKLAIENGRYVRKKILREICRELGLGTLADVEKKALQYGTGLEKLLRKKVYNP